MLIGFSISAYQTEGNNIYSDWYYFEQKGLLPKSGEACKLWERYEEVIKYIKDLNMNAFRFSIEWSRIFPEKNRINYSNLRRYLKFIKKLRENNIEPLVTLWHFTNPKWFFDLGGWLYSENIQYFLDYVDLIAKNIDVRYFITLNEPLVYSLASYFYGAWPPFRKIESLHDLKDFLTVLENLYRAHEETYKVIKEIRESEVGIIIAFPIFRPSRFINPFIKDLEEVFLVKNRPKKVDFIGLNYYGISKSFQDIMLRKYKSSPETMIKIIKRIKKEMDVPIMITENGINTDDELERVLFVKKHLETVLKNKDRYDIRGYFIWTLCDNYEWEMGYKAKFGFLTRDLKPKDSYYELKRILKGILF